MLPTRDAVRCAGASASSFQPGAPPLAAVDGSPATDWQPVALPARLTVSVRGGLRTLRSAVLRWKRQWPSAPGPNIPPPPAPVITLRASSYTLLVSRNGSTWRRVATVSGRASGTVDVVRFKAVRARFVRVEITAATGSSPPMLDELKVAG